MFSTYPSISTMAGPHFPSPDPAEFVLVKQRGGFDSPWEPHLTWCVQCLSFGASILILATLRCSGEVLASGYGTLAFERPGVVRYRDNTVSRTDFDTVSANPDIFGPNHRERETHVYRLDRRAKKTCKPLYLRSTCFVCRVIARNRQHYDSPQTSRSDLLVCLALCQLPVLYRLSEYMDILEYKLSKLFMLARTCCRFTSISTLSAHNMFAT